MRYAHGEKHGAVEDRPPLIPTGISAAHLFLPSSSLAAQPFSGQENMRRGEGSRDASVRDQPLDDVRYGAHPSAISKPWVS